MTKVGFKSLIPRRSEMLSSYLTNHSYRAPVHTFVEIVVWNWHNLVSLLIVVNTKFLHCLIMQAKLAAGGRIKHMPLLELSCVTRLKLILI